MDVLMYGEWDLAAYDRDYSLLWRETIRNGVTLVGLTALVTDFFAGGVQKPNWYGGLINASGYSSVSENDTMTSHSGWTEVTAYDGSTRKAWTPLVVSNGLIYNSTSMIFNFTASSSIRGLFLASDSTKSGTTGTLWSTAIMSSTRSFESGQLFSATYRVRAAGGT